MEQITTLLVSETRRRILHESIPRVRTCLNLLDNEQIWQRPTPDMASIGHLVLHVSGNARQWILHALLGQPDIRDRTSEFSERQPLDKAVLLNLLDDLEADLDRALPEIRGEMLLSTHAVQVFEESGVAILVHAIEHFSYHTGQIARDTKRLLHVDLGFYADLDL